MKEIVVVIKRSSLYYICCSLFWVIATIFLLCTSKDSSFVILNKAHSQSLDTFFANYTFLGDGIFALSLVIILFCCGQKKAALYVLLAFLSSGIVAQVLKNLIYAPRPKTFYYASQYIYELDAFSKSGIGASSFPSGHTTSAFAIATALAAYIKNHFLNALFFLMAALVGYSRVYLAQHFPLDVLAGASIGTMFATLSVVLYNSKTMGAQKFLQRRSTAMWGKKNYPDTAIS